MMQSENMGKILSATEEIRKARDTSMLGALLYGTDDTRVSHLLFFTRKSEYQVKMEALKEITEINTPDGIINDVDTSIIQFYLPGSLN